MKFNGSQEVSIFSVGEQEDVKENQCTREKTYFP